jgi:RNA polymerase sigma-70 factor (ECF subfamily)
MEITNKLIEDCKKGKPEAQRQLFNQYSPLMLNVCLHYVNNHQEAEEALIKGFYNIFYNINSYRSEGPFEAWMRRIMVNTSIDLLRKKQKAHNFLVLDDIQEAALPWVLPSENLEHHDIMALVQQLPQGYRVVLILFAIEGYSHLEIAKMLGITESTSKTQLLKARKYLQKLLSESEPVITHTPYE